MPKRGGLARLAAGLEREIAPAVFAAAAIVEEAAKASIVAGSMSGKGHVPSAPGEAPNNDLGGLVGNIETTQPEPTRALVSSNARYSQALEFGTSRMRERPFMVPAAVMSARDVGKAIAKGVERAIRKAGS